MSKDSLNPNVSVSRIIPKEESSEFQTWSIPEVKSQKDEEQEELANIPMITAEQLEEIHQQAYQEGYQEGHNQGYNEGLGKGQEEGKAAGHKQAFEASLQAIQNQTLQFDQIFKSLQEPLEQMGEQVEYEVASLAMAIAKQIIADELQANPEHIVHLVKKTLQLLPSKSKSIKIYLHPSDLQLIKNVFDLDDDLDINRYQLIDDTSLNRGGCVVDTDISHIDANLDKRINDIASSLVPHIPENNRSESSESDAMLNPEHQETAETAVTEAEMTTPPIAEGAPIPGEVISNPAEVAVPDPGSPDPGSPDPSNIVNPDDAAIANHPST